MKQTIILGIIFLSIQCQAQKNADAITGRWLSIPKEDLIIEVYKSNNQYKGKIYWIRNKNSKTKTGYLILENLKYNSKEQIWENGKIHDPNSGRTYKAIVQIKPDGILDVRGYLGIQFFGTNKYFKRINKKR